MAYASTEQQRQYSREHYRRNREKHIAQAAIRNKIQKKKLIEYAWEFKKKNPCCKCGESDPACLDFHHVGDDKEREVAIAARLGWSVEHLQLEMDKCIIVCANCHRKLHYAERNT